MTASRWRDHARKVIAASLAATVGQPLAARIAAIDAVYPFGPRQHHPYKIWLSERRRAIASLATDPIDVKCPACGSAPGMKCKPIAIGREILGIPDSADGKMHASRRQQIGRAP